MPCDSKIAVGIACLPGVARYIDLAQDGSTLDVWAVRSRPVMGVERTHIEMGFEFR
jgi:hypothetical protein